MKLGLCMPGGGAGGAIQVGMLKCISERIDIDNISVISSVSVGSINSAIFCQHNMAELIYFWSNIHKSDIYKNHSLKNILHINSLYDNSPVMNIIDKKINFEYLKNIQTKLYVTATNSISGDSISVCNHDHNFKDVMKGSVSIPLLFPEIESDGLKLWDGSITNNIPLNPLIHEGCEIIITLNCRPEHIINRYNKNSFGISSIYKLIEIMYRSSQLNDRRTAEYINKLIDNHEISTKMKRIKFIDIYPTVDTPLMDFNGERSVIRIKDGYKSAHTTLKNLSNIYHLL